MEDYNKIIKLINDLFEIDNSLLEQEIKFDASLTNILKDIKDKNEIAKFLYNILASTGNVLTIDGEMKNVEEVGSHPKKADYLEITFRKPNGSIAKQEMKIGRFINTLLKEIKKINIKPKPQDIEDFVKKIYAYRGGLDDNYEFRVVNGKDIVHFYYENNYECDKGGLGGSCMRSKAYSKAIEKFYVNLLGKDIVELLIKINKNTKKIVGRALLWHLPKNRNYLDRVYVADNKFLDEMIEYARKNLKINYCYDYDYDESFKIEIELNINEKDFNDFLSPENIPYLDTFSVGYYIYGKDLLILSSDDDDQKMIKKYNEYTIKYFSLQEFLSKIIHIGSSTKTDLTTIFPFLKNAKYKGGSFDVNEYGDLVYENGTWINGTWENGIFINGTWENGVFVDGEFINSVWKNGECKDIFFKSSTWINGTFNWGSFDENSIWKNGTWKNGNWLGGRWMNGVWENGRWSDGLWEDGIWKAGAHLKGIWKKGTWKKGVWQGGTWENGTWENGEWHNGTWNKGNWKDGVWFKGTWKDGEWIEGSWYDGLHVNGNVGFINWRNGMWMNGTLEDGIWMNGTWKDGTWQSGTWQNGTWINGTWENGEWKRGEWKDGKWKMGTWHQGFWRNGTWVEGEWRNGDWSNGTWENGTWEQGIWKKGTWYGGIWYGGTWYGGTWKKGKWLDKNNPAPNNVKESFKLLSLEEFIINENLNI